MNNITRILITIFLSLHALVHLWYVVLSQKLVEFKPQMGWTGNSWLLSVFLSQNIVNLLATIFFTLATIIFIIAGITFYLQTSYSKALLIGASIFSSIIILIFWDGSTSMLVEKGILGLIINIAIIILTFIY